MSRYKRIFKFFVPAISVVDVNQKSARNKRKIRLLRDTLIAGFYGKLLVFF